MMKTQMLVMLGGLFAAAFPVGAQIRPLNPSGVSAAHEHLIITDEAASTAFWTTIGGTPEHIGTMAGVKFPGVYILLQANRGRGGRGGAGRQGGGAPGGGNAAATPTAPPATPPPPPESSVGSVAEGIGFTVKNLHDTLARLDALGIKPQPGGTATTASVMSPEKVLVLLTEDTSLPTDAASRELRMKVPNPSEAAEWYAKWFGATVVHQGNDAVARIPGMDMRFVQTSEAAAGTHGRALDHIGFEVENLQAFASKLQDGGVTINTPFRTMSLGFLTAITFITDPWGTYIELNQGYASAAK
jgi:catechol 2,3-dioxygenase-like lactoylglutathione lyase family enzyme